MKKLLVVKSGTSSNGTHWALVSAESEGFVMTGFVHTTELREAGEIEVPTAVFNAVEWQA